MEKKKLRLKFVIFAIFFLIFAMFLTKNIPAREVNCLLDNPLAVWHFNEGNGTNAQDACYGYNTTFYGSMDWTNSTPYGNALKFNGYDSYVDAGNFFNQNMQEFSFSLWTNISYQVAYQTLFQSGNYYTNEYLEALQINEGDNDYVIFMSNLGYPPIDDGVWHNIAGTFNGSDNGNVSLYIDGVLVSNVLTYQSQIDATANLLYFGVNYANGFVLNGALDDIAFFNRTLNSREVKDLSNNYGNNNLSLVLYVNSYPYVDFNTTYDVKVKLFNNITELDYGHIIMSITESNGSITNILLPYNSGDGYYETSLLFNQVGDYPFVITANSYDFGFKSLTGTFLVRNPFYITYQIFKNKNNTRYINNFAYITAEYARYPYDSTIENMINPIGFQYSFKTKVFHADYNNGIAVLKLYDANVSYAIRIMDGIIDFPSIYSVPNISKSYGTNIFLGTDKYSGINQTRSYLLTSKELNQYRWFANIIMLGCILVAIIVGFGLIFAFPQYPTLAIAFTSIFIIFVVITRIVVLIWTGH